MRATWWLVDVSEWHLRCCPYRLRNCRISTCHELINPVVDVNAPAETSNTDANCKEEQVPKTTSLGCFPQTPQFMDIVLELSVLDPTAANNITLHTLDIDENVSTTHSLLRLQKYASAKGGFIVSATLRAPSNTPISAGSWSLVAYSATSLPGHNYYT